MPTPRTIQISFSLNTTSTTLVGTGLVFQLQSARVSQASDVSSLSFVNDLVPGAKVWVDDNGNGQWETLEKQDPFVENITLLSGFAPSAKYGASVAQTNTGSGAIVGAPAANSGAGQVMAYYSGSTLDYHLSQAFELGTTGTANFGNMVNFGAQTWAVAGANTSFSGAGYAVIIYRDSVSRQYSIAQLLLPPDQNYSPYNFGTAGVISSNERWMYISSPRNNIVYAYNRVDIESQSIGYLSDGSKTQFQYNTAIQIDYTKPNQLVVMVGTNTAVEGIDYSVNQADVVFAIPPIAGQAVKIIRNQEVQLDDYHYYDIQPSWSTGGGYDSSFNVNVVRGVYQVKLVNGGISYLPNDKLIIYGSQLGGVDGINDLTITVVNVVNTAYSYGKITVFSVAGQGVTNTTRFAMNKWLYTATNTYSFSITVNDIIQRPNVDYTFDPITTLMTFVSIPAAGAKIIASSNTYWQYVTSIASVDSITNDMFGSAVETTTDGRQIMIGAAMAQYKTVVNGNLVPTGPIKEGVTYVFDRSVVRYIVSDPTQMTYGVANTITPVSVIVNNVFLLSTAQSLSGQYTINANKVNFTNITFNYGDIIEIETDQITQIQQIESTTPTYEAAYGTTIAVASTNTTMYVSAPYDSTYVPQAGSVDILENQSRIYGVITSTIANPQLYPGGTLRINNTEITVPDYPNNTLSGLASVINSSGIPNIIAATTPNLTFVGDGTTKVFNIGSMYADASSYTSTVYLDNQLLANGSQYSYDPITQSINFVYAPPQYATILVVSGRLTFSVQNSAAATTDEMLTVLPGTVNSIFNTLGFNTFVFTQQILSPSPTPYGLFGYSSSVNTSGTNVVIGSPNGNVYELTTFDAGQTYFDEHSTTISNIVINGGVAYTYDYFPSNTDNISNPGQYAFGQQIYNDIISTNDSFGVSVNYANGKLMIGATGNTNSSSATGYATVFNNPTNSPAWTTIRSQQPVVDVYSIDGVFAYNGGQAIGVNDTINGAAQTYFDFIDPLQGKILGIARQNIDYIGAVDPAQYNAGSVHNNGNVWGPEHIGQMWWDTNTIRFIDPSQDDITYASRRWGTTFPGSSADIYQWVESSKPPTNYTGQGTPLSTVSYSVSSQLGQNNIFQTMYYFWVKGITVIASGSGKTLSPTGVASYILDPRSSGLPYIAGLGASTIAIYNAQNLISGTNTILSIGFDRQLTDAVIHQEYQIITDGEATSFLNTQLYRKFQDSLSGMDTFGNTVPDPLLSPGMKYGVAFRPRQSMFADRFTALENYLSRANTILAQYPISETRSFNLLNSSQPKPTVSSGAWNAEVPNIEVLSYQNLAVVPVGYKYLVDSDSGQNGRWTIYQVGPNQTLSLIQIQNYDTPLYWYYVNWYAVGYNSSIPPVAAVQNYGQLSTLGYKLAPVGSSVRVIANGAGKWEIYLRTSTNPSTGWARVGLEDGTIAFSETLWNYSVGNFGFDSQVFDSQYFDETPQLETRYIIQALNEEIYIDDLALERNSSLILMFNYVYSEFTDPSWLVKTSYVNIDHNLRSLQPYQTYLEDNQDFIVDYFQEVKPYHVQVRQYNLIYDGQDEFYGDLTDYDLPSYWNPDLQVPQFISPVLTPYDVAITPNYSTLSDTPPDSQLWIAPSLYSNWFNNYSLILESITITNGGSGYTVPPTIVVTGNYITPATMTAIINNTGQVIAINILDYGSGWVSTPILTVVGGNGSGCVLYPKMTTSMVRSIKTTIKYDRYQYQTNISEWVPGSAYQAGSQVRHNNEVWQAINNIPSTLITTYATATPGSSTLTVSNSTGITVSQLIDGFGIPSGTIVLGVNGQTITMSQEIYSVPADYVVNFYPPFNLNQWTIVDASTLSGVDRTMGYYVGSPNEPGLNLPLLIDGISYPGVQVTGLDFDISPGFGIPSFDEAPFENLSYNADGLPTYDLSILDTIFESSYLDQYLGTRATDINVSGGAYVDTYESHAPEELVPGIEYDTLDFRVYTTPGADWLGLGHSFPEKLVRSTYLSTNPTISFANQAPYPIAVTVTDESQGYDLALGTDYTISWVNQTITILSSSALVVNGDQIGVCVYELGGGNQLYKQTYNGSTVGNSLVVPVEYSLIQEFAIFVNGAPISHPADFTFSDNSAIAFGTTLISFTHTYTSTDFISLVAIGPTTINGITTNYSWSLPVTQNIPAVTGTSVYALTNNLEYTNPVNAIVTVAGVRARMPAGIEYVGDATTTVFAVAQRLNLSRTPTNSEILVYINDILQTSGYTTQLSITNTTVTFATAPVVGARIYIAVSTNAQAIIDPVAKTVTISGLTPITGHIIGVTTFNDTREQRLATLVYVGPVITSGSATTQAFDTVGFDQANVTNTPGAYDYSSPPGTFTGNTVTGSPIITNVSSFTGITVGRLISGVGIPANTTVQSFNTGAHTITLTSSAIFNGTNVTLSYGFPIVENNFYLGRVITDPSRLWVSLNGKMLNPDIEYTIGNTGTAAEGSELVLYTGVIQVTDVLEVTMVSESVVPEALNFRIFQDMRGVQATYRIDYGTTTAVAQPVSTTDDVIYVANSGALTQPNFAANVWGVVTIGGERIMYRYINEIPIVGHPGQFTQTPNVISGLLRGTAGTAIANHSTGAAVYNMGRGEIMPSEFQDYIVSNSTQANGTMTTFSAQNISGTSTLITSAVEVYVGGILQTSGYIFNSYSPVSITFNTAPAAGSEVTILINRGVTWYAPGLNTPSNGVPLQETNTPAALFLRANQ